MERERESSGHIKQQRPEAVAEAGVLWSIRVDPKYIQLFIYIFWTPAGSRQAEHLLSFIGVELSDGCGQSSFITACVRRNEVRL